MFSEEPSSRIAAWKWDVHLACVNCYNLCYSLFSLFQPLSHFGTVVLWVKVLPSPPHLSHPQLFFQATKWLCSVLKSQSSGCHLKKEARLSTIVIQCIESFVSLCVCFSAFLHTNTFEYWRERYTVAKGIKSVNHYILTRVLGRFQLYMSNIFLSCHNYFKTPCYTTSCEREASGHIYVSHWLFLFILMNKLNLRLQVYVNAWESRFHSSYIWTGIHRGLQGQHRLVIL